jgi:PAS domain S-box-containing protein
MPPLVPAAEPAGDDYYALIESLGDVVFRLDGRGRCLFLSPAVDGRLGWERVGWVGKMSVRFIDPADREVARQQWRMLASGETRTYRGELRFLTASGAVCWMLVRARGLRGDRGEWRGMIGLLTDISAAKALEAELNVARAAAELANQSKSEFISTLSHELRTPLNAVIGLSESLLEEGAPFEAERTQRYLGMIHRSGRQLLATINDIIDLVRIEAGQTKPNFASLELGSICTSVGDVAQRDARAKAVLLTVVRPEHAIRLTADEKLLRQLLQNLLSNAVKFTPADGRVTLVVSSRPEGGAAIEIADTGIGIAADKVAQLFQPFTQGDASLSRQYSGTGLGLALVDRIARLHGATVAVRSAPGRGSTFTLELSAEPAAPAKFS